MDRNVVARFREELCSLHSEIVSKQAQLIDKIAECAAGGYWEADGAGSVSDWLMATLNIDFRTASEWVELARRLKELPVLTRSFSEGRMPFASVNAAAKLAEPATDAFITAEAEAASTATLLKALKRKEALEAEKASPAPRSSLRWFFDSEGWCQFRGWLPPEEGARIITALERAEAALPGPNPETGTWDPAETKAANALVALSDTALGKDDDPARATVVVHVDVEDLICGEGSGELAAGGVVTAQVVRRLACDANIETVLEDRSGTHSPGTHSPGTHSPGEHGPGERRPGTHSPGEGLGTGHPAVVGIVKSRRQIPHHLLRHLKKRDGGCRFPGCGRTRHLHAHHIKHWVNGGPTEMGNLLLLCNRHHSLMHEGKWSITGNPEPGPGRDSTLQFIREDGSVYVPNPLLGADRQPGEQRPPGDPPRGERPAPGGPPAGGRPPWGRRHRAETLL